MTSRSSRKLFEQAIVVDTTAPIAPFAEVAMALTPAQRVKPYVTAGVTLAVFTLVDDFPNSIEQTVKLTAANRRFFLADPDRYSLVETSQEVRAAKAQGKLAVAFAFQGTNALLGELALVEIYRRLGVVQMLLAYNAGNFAADGCHETRNAGLSQFGRDLVGEMNRVGVIVDLSHVGLKSSLEAIEIASRPPIFSHSTPKRFNDHDRNISDEQIRACAAKDGLIGLTGLGVFLDGVSGKATAQGIADTVDYVVQLVGPRHAAFGLDHILDSSAMGQYLVANTNLYGGGAQYPTDGAIESAAPSILGDVSEILLKRGLSEADIRAILGENYLRVLDANSVVETPGTVG